MKKDFDYAVFHQKFTNARTFAQKQHVKQQHSDFLKTLTDDEKQEYKDGLQEYGRLVSMKIDEQIEKLAVLIPH